MTQFPNYEGVDELGSFTDPTQLEAYREALLDKSEFHTTLIADFVGTDLKVCEIGSGNGRLPIALVTQGIAEAAIGIELSKSRTEFATKWAKDLNLDPESCMFMNDNVLELADEIPAKLKADLVVCITGCFQYFTSNSDRTKLLKRMRSWGKRAMFELYDLPSDVAAHFNTGTAKPAQTWSEIKDDPRWHFYLSRWTRTIVDNVYVHEKIFINHNGKVDAGRSEKLKYYDPWMFIKVLAAAGFGRVIHAIDYDYGVTVIVE